MLKWFNTAGPCQADIHYMLSPLARLPQLERLIAQRGYFVIHAPRQTGKATVILGVVPISPITKRTTTEEAKTSSDRPLTCPSTSSG